MPANKQKHKMVTSDRNMDADSQDTKYIKYKYILYINKRKICLVSNTRTAGRILTHQNDLFTEKDKV